MPFHKEFNFILEYLNLDTLPFYLNYYFMKKYWFYGIMPRDAINETSLSEKQKEIVKEEAEKLSPDNHQHGWLGYFRNNKWEFMRHGFEMIVVDEPRGNVARMKLTKILDDKYGSV